MGSLLMSLILRQTILSLREVFWVQPVSVCDALCEQSCRTMPEKGEAGLSMPSCFTSLPQ